MKVVGEYLLKFMLLYLVCERLFNITILIEDLQTKIDAIVLVIIISLFFYNYDKIKRKDDN